MIVLDKFEQFNNEFPVLLNQSWFWWVGRLKY